MLTPGILAGGADLLGAGFGMYNQYKNDREERNATRRIGKAEARAIADRSKLDRERFLAEREDARQERLMALVSNSLSSAGSFSSTGSDGGIGGLLPTLILAAALA